MIMGEISWPIASGLIRLRHAAAELNRAPNDGAIGDGVASATFARGQAAADGDDDADQADSAADPHVGVAAAAFCSCVAVVDGPADVGILVAPAGRVIDDGFGSVLIVAIREK